MRLGLRSADAKQGCFYQVEFDCSDLSFVPLQNGICTAVMPGSTHELFLSLYRAMCPAERNLLASDCYLLLTLQEISKYAKSMPAQQVLYDRVCRYILMHTTDDLSVQKIADALGYHKDHICRTVRRCSGKTVKELIMKERIHTAKGLLSSTNYSIAKIAFLLQFPSANSFIKYFKYHVAMTPSEYRRTK